MMDATENQRSGPTPRPLAKSLMIVEDDQPLMQSLARAMEAQGFRVITANSVAYAFDQIQLSAPEYALVDMRFHDGGSAVKELCRNGLVHPTAQAA